MRSLRLLIYSTILCVSAVHAQYTGTALVSQGPALTLRQNLYSCSGARVCGEGQSSASDGSKWIVPAATNFTESAFPLASDLYNSCDGHEYTSASQAIKALDGSDIVQIDASGELISAYIFADNYFELYINGVAVGKDRVPYTPFNSSIVRFRVSKPFTIAMMLVDWEEHLGLGSESNNGHSFHDGDGGMVAVFKDSQGEVLAITNDSWKAQTFYTSPITDLRCASEKGNIRVSAQCSTQDSDNGSTYYALHWPVPEKWMSSGFDDSQWPNATEVTNAEIGVDNKPAYTNFRDIFDFSGADAQFIWSTNVILDNLVLVRKTVGLQTGVEWTHEGIDEEVYASPNPSNGTFRICTNGGIRPDDIHSITVFNTLGQPVPYSETNTACYNISSQLPGLYTLVIQRAGRLIRRTVVVQ